MCYKCPHKHGSGFGLLSFDYRENRNYFSDVWQTGHTARSVITCGEKWNTACCKEHMRGGVYHQVGTKEKLIFTGMSEKLAR